MTRSAAATAAPVVVAALVALLSMPAAAKAQQRQTTLPPPLPLLAQTPPMGWNSWNTFGCTIDEGTVRAQADAMVSIITNSSTGENSKVPAGSLRDLGYEFVNIDGEEKKTRSWSLKQGEERIARSLAPLSKLIKKPSTLPNLSSFGFTDCWMAPQRNAATGELEADPQRFPSGIAALAAYVHARGLKLGIYSSPGPQTCAGRAYYQASLGGRLPFLSSSFPLLFPSFPGSQGHEARDAATFAAWGVDYLKYDRCTSPADEAERAFALMRDSLAATGRPVVYSINPDENRSSGKKSGVEDAVKPKRKSWSGYADLWRTTRDVDPAWRQLPWSQGFWSTGVVDAIDVNGPLFANGAGPGRGWNDPDMLQVGVEKPWLFGLLGEKKRLALSDVEGRTQFSMWAMMAAPLVLGNDLAKMAAGEDAATAETLTNAEVIAIDQDPLGAQGRRVASFPSPGKKLFGRDFGSEVWVKPLADGGFAVALLNRGKASRVVRVEWSDVAFVGRDESWAQQRGNSRVRVRDVWRHADVGEFDVVGGSGYYETVEAHGVVVLRVAFVQ